MKSEPDYLNLKQKFINEIIAQMEPEQFNSTEKDIINEILNIAFSKAADSLSMMMGGKKILIKSPDVHFVKPNEYVDSSTYKNQKNIALVYSDIEGEVIQGSTLLMFSEKDRAAIIDSAMDIKPDTEEEYRLIEESFLMEVGNILIASIVTQYSNIFRIPLTGGVPYLEFGDIESVEHVILDCPYYESLKEQLFRELKTILPYKNLKELIQAPRLEKVCAVLGDPKITGKNSDLLKEKTQEYYKST